MTIIDRSPNPLADTRPWTWRGVLRTGKAYLTGGTIDAMTATNLTVTQEAWTAPTLLNSWVDYGAPNQTARYRKDASGVVHIQGLVKTGTITAGTTVFTLPTGYRPANDLIVAGVAPSGVLAATTIAASGNLLTGTGWSATWTAINFSFATG